MEEPRLLITWDREKEVAVFNTCLTILKMAEDAPDDMTMDVPFTLGELRNHVQFCQYAGGLTDQAAATQNHFLQMQRSINKLTNECVRKDEEIERLKKVIADAKTDTQRRA